MPLDLGDEVYGATLQLSAEGPHLDLSYWKHCRSDWKTALDAVWFVLPTPSAQQYACFPDYTRAELEAAVRAHTAAQGDAAQADAWIPRIG